MFAILRQAYFMLCNGRHCLIALLNPIPTSILGSWQLAVAIQSGLAEAKAKA